MASVRFSVVRLPVNNLMNSFRPIEIAEDRGTSDEISYPDFLDYRNQSTSFVGLSAEDMLQVAIDAENQNDVIWGQVVSANYFDVVQIKPLMGRAFMAEEDKTLGASPVVVLGHSFWQRRLGSDPNIVGKTVQMNNRAYQVIGVAPQGFTGTKFALMMDFWVPISMAEDLRRSPELLTSRGSHWMNVIGRIKPGVSMEQASAEFNAIASRLNQAYPDDRTSTTQGKVMSEVDGRWEEMAMSSGAARHRDGIVGLILLIACANVANLMLARAALVARRSAFAWLLVRVVRGWCANS